MYSGPLKKDLPKKNNFDYLTIDLERPLHTETRVKRGKRVIRVYYIGKWGRKKEKDICEDVATRDGAVEGENR